jgi:hypothetical protein
MSHIRSGFVISKLLLLFALTACNFSASADKSLCQDSAQKYWKSFRTKVIQSDVKGVAELTQFPFFISSGIVDDDRQNKPVSKEEFIKQYPLLLIMDPGLSIEASTMFDLINSNEKLKDISCSDDGAQFRVGDWVFEYKPNGWKFVQAYTDEN